MSYEKEPPTYPPAFNAAPASYAAPAGYAPPVGYAAQPYMIQSDASQIRDYLAWSIVNLFCGWGIGGILPLVFSIMCRNYKAGNDISGARSMSTLALVFNIVVTVLGAIGWISFIVSMIVFAVAVNSYS